MIKRVGVPAPTPISVPGSISRSWGEVMERSYSIEFSSDTFPVSQCKAGRFPLILLNFFLTVKHFNRLCFYPALCNLNLQAFPHQTAHWIFFFFFLACSHCGFGKEQWAVTMPWPECYAVLKSLSDKLVHCLLMLPHSGAQDTCGI